MSEQAGVVIKKGGGGGGSVSNSITYDNSAIHEARKSKSAANQMQGKAWKAAYDGDISTSMDTAQSIRSLQQQAKDAHNTGSLVASKRSSATAPTKGTQTYSYDNRPTKEK
jgi:hypothetical protein